MSGLNGAYYGPTIPPKRTSRSVGRGSSCNPCCIPCCLLGSLFNCLFSIVITIIVVLGIAVLALWLIFRPNELKVYVDNAVLTKFDLATATNNNLQYNLALNMSLRNPNKRIGFDYNYIEADAYYAGSRFAYTQLPTFYQGHKNTTELNPVFVGTGLLVNGDSDLKTRYTREKGEGYYYVDVKLFTRLKLKVWWFKLHQIKPEVRCTVKLPVPSATSGTTTSTGSLFERTKCDVRYF